MRCTIDEIVSELEGFIHWLSYEKQVPDTIMMDSDEITGELFLELVKGFQYYEDKDLSKPEMIAVLKRMMDNRISELIYKYFVTHRKEGINYIPVDLLIDRSDPDESGGVTSNGTVVNGIRIKTDVVISAHVSLSVDPESIVSSNERVQQTLAKLSEQAKEVLQAIIYGNELLQMNLQLAGDRAKYVYKNGGTVKIKPWHVADSLGMDEDDVKKSFTEITTAYEEVCNG